MKASIILINKKKINDFKKNVIFWKSTLSPKKIEMIFNKPESLSISNLYKYINYLEINKENTLIYRLNIWKKIFIPLYTVIMILIGIYFIFKFSNKFKIEKVTLKGTLWGFTFYLFNNIFINLSLIYKFSPFFSTLLPSIMFLLTILFYLKKNNFFEK